ncbi:hypothetical protein DICPUDRAFT_25268 [Dictyostelium purpureum]|uniref:FNIP repeat-containing protein n=1 Tax=Dictyostelium purpureum TaxID=5786 RepID=F0Z6V1_DICPU|nr:uncharacterized protein DICPUDRAFT_25268 [Dictyostelium purpureum]EGC40326.1 hypothetical protein DICPUDRAFT_25268 [Dictyostelium purpureum]|eukprot:XP_003283077.1 hypothetical protein DICPUDRAFT_25268 [Dictyostelium purpureum]
MQLLKFKKNGVLKVDSLKDIYGNKKILKDYITTLHIDSNKPIKDFQLPQYIETLTFDQFNRPISLNLLPHSITDLDLGFHFNHPIQPNTLPPSLKTLAFSNKFNQLLSDGVIPVSVETLIFGDSFNQSISPGHLPPLLKTLIFGCNFNQTIKENCIPKSVRVLEFGFNFNQKFLREGIIPEGVVELEFGFSFKNNIGIGIIPSTVRKLRFRNKEMKLKIDLRNYKSITTVIFSNS